MSKFKVALALSLALAACSKGERAKTPGAAAPAAVRIDRADDPIPSQYLVVLQPGEGTSAEVAASLLAGTDATLLVSYERALRGFAVRASEATVRSIGADPRVAWIAQDGRVKAQALKIQNGAPAALDRLDQRGGTDGSYAYQDCAGERVNAYVLDTGIQGSHVEFLGRAPELVDFVKDGGTGDCNGHGTHVAGIIGGATWGVAKKVSLHSLRVLGCDGAGSTSNLVAALDWLIVNARTPAVANLSLSRSHDAALDAAVAAVVAAGIPVVVSAGDQGRDACASSPARVPEALTVASVGADGTSAASFSNQGPCVDLFAPGVDVRSASIAKDPSSLTWSGSVPLSGTSVSAPFVTGAVALYLGRYTSASPSTIEKALFANSTRAPATVAPHTPDRFLFTLFVDDDNAADIAQPVVTLGAPAAGAVVSGDAVAVAVTATD
ncbi:MAG TPA: S8 family serine peptidase, partial [Anaeromyxobacteraceae bacterium]|nr:S8 family serine peptidase [Anaeromyxobacteraceae bacterium]